MKLQNIALALGLAGTGLIGSVMQASAITYQLNDVRFQDGATLTGTFDYSPYTLPYRLPSYYNINLTTSGGDTSTFPPATYSTQAYSQYGLSGGSTFFGADGAPINNGFARFLNLSFATPLTGTPGDQSLIAIPNSSYEIVGYFDPPLNLHQRVTAMRKIVGGSVFAVPEPTEQGLVAFGLPVLLGLRSLKKRNASATK